MAVDQSLVFCFEILVEDKTNEILRGVLTFNTDLYTQEVIQLLLHKVKEESSQQKYFRYMVNLKEKSATIFICRLESENADITAPSGVVTKQMNANSSEATYHQSCIL